MRYVIEVDSQELYRTLIASVIAKQNLDSELGPVHVENLVMGMQHELGVVAALTMGQADNHQEIQATLLTVISMAMVYFEALIPGDEEEENAVR